MCLFAFGTIIVSQPETTKILFFSKAINMIAIIVVEHSRFSLFYCDDLIDQINFKQNGQSINSSWLLLEIFIKFRCFIFRVRVKINYFEKFIIFKHKNMFESIYPNQDLKTLSQLVRKAQYKSQSDINNTLAVYFSEQFLNKIKNQISQKTKPSKSILEALKHSNSQLIQYKKQIQELKEINSALKTQKNQLLQVVSKLKQKQFQPQFKSEQLKNTKVNLKTAVSKFIHIEGNEQNYEIVILKEKMNHLEEGKRLKETRLKEMIDKQSKLVAQIDILKYKNQILSSTVNCLQETVQDISRKTYFQPKQQEAILGKTDSKEAQFVQNYINVDNIKQAYNNSFLKVGNEGERQRSSLAVSCTRNVQIEQDYNIEILAIKNSKQAKQVQKNSDFQQIDGLLEQYLPETNTCRLISENFTASQVEVKNLIMQSQIQIIIDR